MNQRALLAAAFGFSSALLFAGAAPPADADKYWPQWRGPMFSGAAPTANPPVEWSESKNIKWKIEVPGKGSATPIVWGDRVFVLCAVPAEKAASEADPAYSLRSSLSFTMLVRCLFISIVCVGAKNRTDILRNASTCCFHHP